MLAPAFLPAVGSIGLLRMEGRSRDATTWCRRAVALDPLNVAALHNLILAEHGSGVGTLRRLLCLEPSHAEGGRLMAAFDREQGIVPSAQRRLRRVLAGAPLSVAALADLAELQRRLARTQAAQKLLRAAAAVAPGEIAVINSLGTLAQSTDHVERAAAYLRRGLAVDGRHPALWANLGLALAKARPATARRAFRRAIALGPGSADSLAGLAAIENAARDEDRAQVLCRRATALSPDSVLPRSIVAAIERSRGHLSVAAGQCRRILAQHPGDASSFMTLGTACLEMRTVRSAVSAYGRAQACHSGYVDAERNLLYALLHLPDVTEDELFRAAAGSARRHQPAMAQRLSSPSNDPNPDRRLRIGYVSSDFRDHPNRWFMNSLFEHGDRSAFHVTCYSAGRQMDRETEWIRARVDGWRDVAAMDDAALASALRADALDIAVFLGGRFDGNRPMVAAYGAAPVQVSYLDGGTSGIDNMHYWITDGVLHPEERTVERFTEELVRLPHFYSFTRPMPPLGVGSLPATSFGGVTFGTFAQPARVTDDVVEVWSRILKAVPGSRLMLKSRNRYGDSGNRRELAERYAGHGIDAGRIVIEAANDDHASHLARYGRVDIALDTFPFSGATTNFEALWMGVPVVTLPGTRFVARMGASILSAIGMPELIATSREDYVRIATNLALDLPRLADIRRSLRPRILASPIRDGVGYARSIEAAYRVMWQKWCRQQAVAAPERSRS